MPGKDFNPELFLSEFWQQKPALIRGFIDQFEDPLDGDELGGLALQADVESRLVRNVNDSYELSHGPFPEETLRTLPTRNWTLLVQAVDIWLEEVEHLKSYFQFIPSWRIDDIMVSFAAAGGGVGPHFDRYDVFLLQGNGSRTWRLGQYCDEDTGIDTSSGLSLLTEFKQEQEFSLQCGDVLYIPPGWAHWGISDDASMCYSIGFRAPSHDELLEEFSTLLMADSSPDERYQDQNPIIPGSSGQIATQDLDGIWGDLQAKLQNRAAFNEAFGIFATKPRYPALNKEYAHSVAADSLLDELGRGTQLQRHPGSRFAYIQNNAGDDIQLFVDGECFICSALQMTLVHTLCDVTGGYTSNIQLELSQLGDQDSKLLSTLISQGSLILQPDSH